MIFLHICSYSTVLKIEQFVREFAHWCRCKNIGWPVIFLSTRRNESQWEYSMLLDSLLCLLGCFVPIIDVIVLDWNGMSAPVHSGINISKISY